MPDLWKSLSFITNISILGVVLTTIINSIFSTIWFSILFDKIWDKHSGFTEEELKKIKGTSHKRTRSGYWSLIEQFISTVIYAGLVEYLNVMTFSQATLLSVILWLGFVATPAVNGVFYNGEKVQFYILHQACYLSRILLQGFIFLPCKA